MKLLHFRSPSYKLNPTNALSIVNVGREVMIINVPGLSTTQVMLVKCYFTDDLLRILA